jgi:cell division protein FtsB
MNVLHKRSRNISGKITTIVFFILLSYFLYHSISGERGLLAMVRLDQELARSQHELDILHSERLQQEHRVKLLRPESLDLDLLDQQARKLIGYSSSNEVVVTPPNQ